MNEDAPDREKSIKDRVETCAHCGAENPPGLLLCLTCGRAPSTGRDLFVPPDILVPDAAPILEDLSPSTELTITLPEPIQVPDPLPIPVMEDFAAPPPQPPLIPPPLFLAPPSEPKDLAPVLSPGLRWTIGLVGLPVLAFLGLGSAASLAALNLPGGMCLGSLWLVAVVIWMAILSARRGESRSTATGARRRLVTSLGQRLFEVTPGAAKEQLANLPIVQVPPLAQPASHLIYLNSTGDGTSQLTQVLLGTMCALVSGDHIQLATQTYEVLTASPLRQNLETVKRAAVSRRTLYIGVGYLEKLVFSQLRRTPSPSARDLVRDVLGQAGTDLLNRIAVDIGEAPAGQDQDPEASDLDAQVAAMREFCQQFKALNPELYEQLSHEIEEAVSGFFRAASK